MKHLRRLVLGAVATSIGVGLVWAIDSFPSIFAVLAIGLWVYILGAIVDMK